MVPGIQLCEKRHMRGALVQANVGLQLRNERNVVFDFMSSTAWYKVGKFTPFLCYNLNNSCFVGGLDVDKRQKSWFPPRRIVSDKVCSEFGFRFTSRMTWKTVEALSAPDELFSCSCWWCTSQRLSETEPKRDKETFMQNINPKHSIPFGLSVACTGSISEGICEIKGGSDQEMGTFPRHLCVCQRDYS